MSDKALKAELAEERAMHLDTLIREGQAIFDLREGRDRLKKEFAEAKTENERLREAVEKFLKAHQRVEDRFNQDRALPDRRCGCKFCEMFRNALAGKEVGDE